MCDFTYFVKERDEAILSLDKDKILAFCEKYGVAVPQNETVLWAGVHKAILSMRAAPPEQKIESMLWLLEHGMASNFKCKEEPT